MAHNNNIMVKVENVDAILHPSDILVLKHAQLLYGLDETVASRYCDYGGDTTVFAVSKNEARFFSSKGCVASSHILVVGTCPQYSLTYADIRYFAFLALKEISSQYPQATSCTFTLHGMKGDMYGLDEIETFTAELAGFIDALVAKFVPSGLNLITIAEINSQRAGRLSKHLDALFPNHILARSYDYSNPHSKANFLARINSAGAQSDTKPRVFVAMPFRKDMDDIFVYGIQNAVHACGFICERADQVTFTGDILTWIKERIKTSHLVIADLTDANPNVHLEVGYAWGVGTNTVLLVKDTNHLQFDTKGQRCLIYQQINELERLLTAELKAIDLAG